MEKSRPSKVVHRGSGGEDAVTPVIGAVLILAISVLGIAGVLFWGAPTIERIQARNAQTAIVGEFEDLRDSSRELSVPDHSRFPTIVLARGELGVTPGSRLLITSTFVAGCSFEVTEWTDSADGTDHLFDAAQTGCTGATAVRASSVSGQSLVEVYEGALGANLAASPATLDLSDGDWRFELLAGTTTIAEAWLVSGDRVEWNLGTGSGERAVYLDSGAIYSKDSGTLFLEKPAVIGDAAFGSDYYGLWLRSLAAGNFGSITGAGSYQIYLSLVGNYVRTDEAAVYSVRYDIAGDLAESWCNGLLERNTDLSGASYAAVSGFGCDNGDDDGVRAVQYTRSGNTAFTFRFLHARIYVSLAV